MFNSLNQNIGEAGGGLRTDKHIGYQLFWFELGISDIYIWFLIQNDFDSVDNMFCLVLEGEKMKNKKRIYAVLLVTLILASSAIYVFANKDSGKLSEDDYLFSSFGFQVRKPKAEHPIKVSKTPKEEVYYSDDEGFDKSNNPKPFKLESVNVSFPSKYAGTSDVVETFTAAELHGDSQITVKVSNSGENPYGFKLLQAYKGMPEGYENELIYYEILESGEESVIYFNPIADNYKQEFTIVAGISKDDGIKHDKIAGDIYVYQDSTDILKDDDNLIWNRVIK